MIESRVASKPVDREIFNGIKSIASFRRTHDSIGYTIVIMTVIDGTGFSMGTEIERSIGEGFDYLID